MSDNVQRSSLSIHDYIEDAGEIRIANQLIGQQMEELFKELVEKAERYRNRLQISEARVESMKQAILKQWQDQRRLNNKLDEITKKLHLAEATAQEFQQKYHQLHSKLKDIVLESAAVANNNDITDL